MNRTEEEHMDLGPLTPERSAPSVHSASPVTRHSSPVTGYTSLLLYLAALGVIFWGTFQLDYPIREFTRSLHVFWLERIGDNLGKLGSGAGLVTVSAVLLAGGYLFNHRQLRQCGVQSLIAHGAVALLIQAMKHTIGRPRPRLRRDEVFFTGPSLDPDLDSFPSGHASAAFAVATVVAKHFPRWAWSVYGLAGFIVVSRVVRGSHYATDVAVGLMLGVLMGSVVARPLREWRASVTGAVADLTPGLAIGFAVLWTLCQPIVDPVQDAMMRWTGALAVAFGAGSRWGSAFRGEPAAFLPYAWPAIGLGLALMTGSWLVVLIAGLVIAAQWLAAEEPYSDLPAKAGARTLAMETTFAVALVLIFLSVQSMKGALAPA